jgi:hypothetical protein
VHKISISPGKILEKLICNNCEELKKFYGFINSIIDNERKIYLEQYADAFAKWVLTDYGAYLIKEKIFNKPFYLYGLNGHPIKSEYVRSCAKWLVNNSELTTIREPRYYYHLLEIGCDHDRMKVYPDPRYPIPSSTSVSAHPQCTV